MASIQISPERNKGVRKAIEGSCLGKAQKRGGWLVWLTPVFGASVILLPPVISQPCFTVQEERFIKRALF